MIALNIAVVKTTFFGVEDSPFTTAYAQSNHSSLSPNELQQQTQDYLSTLMQLQNQTNTNTFSLVDEDNITSGNGKQFWQLYKS